jgi:signal transduction histidine kinase
MSLPVTTETAVARRGTDVPRLALQVLFVGIICSLSTEIGFALKFPPHYISPLWPTGAILFSVLVVTPVRHWWAYILAAYFTSILNDARAGFPLSAILFVVAGIIEILIAAVGVRRFADGPRAFLSLRNLVVYLIVAVVLAPFASAFVAAFAGKGESYWFYWRVWFLSEALAFLMLAPAILTCIAVGGATLKNASFASRVEACLIGCGLVAVTLIVFRSTAAAESSLPALVYLPLPLLLWTAVRFGPIGVNTSLLIVAFLSISEAVEGYGPFSASTPAESVLALQMFLITLSIPLIFLAALIEEGRERTNERKRAELELQEQRRELTHLSRVAILGELSGALAHELNQPLTAILSNAQAAQRLLTQESPDLPEVGAILNDIVDEDKRAGEVIRRLRALLKKGETQLQAIDLCAVTGEVLDLAHADFVTRGVLVNNHLPADLPAVRGDRVQLQQVLLNLIVNACDAMVASEPSRRRLIITAAPDGNDMVQVAIADCGSGIPADRIDRLFEPFFTTKEQGLGLGLAICRSIVAAHGGRLWAANNVEGGATFWLTLPVLNGGPP